jgi:hypothetical protein
MHGVPPVTWSKAVAASAQEWANKGVFKHSSSYKIAPPAGPAGENLAMGHRSIEAADAAWYSEVKNCGPFPGCKSGSNGITGHFTAMIWKGVKEIGCGIYINKSKRPWKRLYVCRYKAGDTLSRDTPNMGGGYKANVPRPIKSESQCEQSSGGGGSPKPAADDIKKEKKKAAKEEKKERKDAAKKTADKKKEKVDAAKEKEDAAKQNDDKKQANLAKAEAAAEKAKAKVARAKAAAERARARASKKSKPTGRCKGFCGRPRKRRGKLITWGSKCRWRSCKGCSECAKLPKQKPNCKGYCGRALKRRGKLITCRWRGCKGCAECSKRL